MADQTTTPDQPITLTTVRHRLLLGLAIGDQETGKLTPARETTRQWLDDHDLLLWDGKNRRWRASIPGWVALLNNDASPVELWGDLAKFDAADAENLGEARDQIRAWQVAQQPQASGSIAADLTRLENEAAAEQTERAKATPTPAAKTTKPCACSTFWAGITHATETGDVEVGDERNTGCDAQTVRVFAPGHDAKLVAFLVKAELDGLELHTGDGMSADAETLMRTFSAALAVKARKARERLQRTAQARQARAHAAALTPTSDTTAPEVEPESIEKPAPGNARIRLTHPKDKRGVEVVARIDTAGNATYAGTNNRRPSVSKFGNYQVIERLDSKTEHQVKVEAMQALDDMILNVTGK